ncbi:hypothetical protein E4U11_002512 [Claviceps purpurea]|nr:hypothetical protein E4U11_002512 [Claviceps purpurea]
MSCGSSVLPLIVPAVSGDEIVQGTRKLREDLFLHLEAPIEVIEMFAQERLGCRVFSSYLPWTNSICPPPQHTITAKICTSHASVFLHLISPRRPLQQVEPNLTRAKAKAAIRTSVAVQDAAQER